MTPENYPKLNFPQAHSPDMHIFLTRAHTALLESVPTIECISDLHAGLIKGPPIGTKPGFALND